MQTIIEFLVSFLLALTGALGVATVWVGGVVFLGGCGLLGGGWCWRAWKRRLKDKLP
jgi:hypothetical protein